MSTAITPSAMSCASRAGSTMKSSEVTSEPRGTGPSIGAGRYSLPVGPSTTTSGITTSPMPTLGPTPPAIPTTITRSKSPRPSRRSVALVASAVPIPVGDRDDVGVPDRTGVRRHAFDERRLQPEGLHDRIATPTSSVRAHRPARARSRSSLPACRKRTRPCAVECRPLEPRLAAWNRRRLRPARLFRANPIR